MKRLPLCALLLSVLCAFARADTQYPTWPKAQVEKASDWKMIFFQDDNKVFHKLYCRVKDCLPTGKPAAGPLFVLTQSQKDAPDGWLPSSGARGFFTATLSHYSLADGKIVRDDGHAGPAIDLKKDMSDVDWRKYTSIVVAAPTAMANDGAPAPAGPAPPKPGEPPKPPPTTTPTIPPALDAQVDAALGDYSPIERAIIKKIASPDDLQKIAKKVFEKDWHAAALDAARHDTDDPSKSPLRDYLKPLGFDAKAFAAYVGCDTLLGSPTSSSGGPSAMDQLKAFRLQSAAGAAAPNPESIKSQADVITAIGAIYPNLQKFCQDTANAGKIQQLLNTNLPQMSLSVTPVPSPGAVTPGGCSDAAPAAFPSKAPGDGAGGGGKGKSWSDKMVDAALGGSIGWVAGALAATMLGLGPLGFFALLIGGAAIGASMALKKDDKKK